MMWLMVGTSLIFHISCHVGTVAAPAYRNGCEEVWTIKRGIAQMDQAFPGLNLFLNQALNIFHLSRFLNSFLNIAK